MNFSFLALFWLWEATLNCYDSPLDKLGGNVSLQKELTNFRTDFHLVDVWRKKYPRDHLFTFNFDKTIAFINFWHLRVLVKR